MSTFIRSRAQSQLSSGLPPSAGLAGGAGGGGLVLWPPLSPALGSALSPGGQSWEWRLRASKVSGISPQQKLGDTCVGEGPSLASPNPEGLVPSARSGRTVSPVAQSPPITHPHPGKESSR